MDNPSGYALSGARISEPIDIDNTPPVVRTLSPPQITADHIRINFDVEVDAAGTTLYLVDGRFDQSGGPYESDFFVATKNVNGFQRLPNSADLLKNINTTALEYAAGVSADNLDFYFTRVAAPLTNSSTPEIFHASRRSSQEAFGVAAKIETITGFVEAPTLSPDGRIIYYHKKENGTFVIFMVRMG